LNRAVGILIVAAVVASGSAVLPGCEGDESGPAQDTDAHVEPSTTTVPETTTAPATPTDLGDAGAEAIQITGDWLAAGAGSIWLSNPPAGDVYRLDPGSGRTVGTIRVPQEPCEASDFGFGALWTATCRVPGLARIDPATNRVRHVRLPVPAELEGEGSIGAGAGAVWLVVDGPDCTACRVARVDPRSLRVVARVSVEPGSAAVRVGAGAVWVTNPAQSVVQRIDVRLNRVADTTEVGPGARFFAVGEDGVWTLNQGDGSVTRLDPGTGTVAATVPADVQGEGGDLTTGGGWVWARGFGNLLTRIDPQTNSVVERYGPSSGSGAVIVGFGAVWISAHDVGTVWRLPLADQ
jgi:virginiamycin B lyase